MASMPLVAMRLPQQSSGPVSPQPGEDRSAVGELDAEGESVLEWSELLAWSVLG
ncbi:MAG: hypothetical protein WCJ35_10015 [Planctomycetota bacterium]